MPDGDNNRTIPALELSDSEISRQINELTQRIDTLLNTTDLFMAAHPAPEAFLRSVSRRGAPLLAPSGAHMASHGRRSRWGPPIGDDIAFMGLSGAGLSTSGVHNQAMHGSRKAVVTLVPVLQKTPYSEQVEEGAERTLEYVKVQRAVLKFLDDNSTEALAPLQAQRWTEAIEPNTKKPKAIEALRLCYYMRSQGYDTYADIKNGMISLFVVNPDSMYRHERCDHLYWKQDYKTNLIVFRLPSSNERYARRNAMPSIPTLSSTSDSSWTPGLPFELGQEDERTRNVEAMLATLDQNRPRSDAVSVPNAQSQSDIRVRAAAAQAALNDLLNEEDTDTS